MRVDAIRVEACIELVIMLDDCMELVWGRWGSMDGIDALPQISLGAGSD